MDVSLNRQVFNKDKFKSTVDTNFTQLVQSPSQRFFDLNLATQTDFFALYQKFFFDIPKEGIVNSHTYLVTESGNYINFQKDTSDIEALLAEIATLRAENLNLQKSLVTASLAFSATQTSK